MDARQLRRRIRALLIFFTVALVISGLTAVPLQWEINLLQALFGEGTLMERVWPALARWITFVHRGITEMKQRTPFIFYGTDWLAFGHVVIALFFLGPLRDPVRNVWVVEAGMVACVLVIPTAMIFGPLRGIPFFWRLFDCAFGVFGILPLWLARRDIRRLAALEQGAEARP
jgi:hypothetical protein